jgi:hypothetical protein
MSQTTPARSRTTTNAPAQELSGLTILEDRQSIADLMTGWIHRDLAEWDQLRELFHPDGTIEISWFEGLASDFVDGSMRMGESDLHTKHVISAPLVTFHGNKAIVETNAVVVGENVRLGLGCSTHARFYDQVEKRSGAWKIVKRQGIYDFGYFNFPQGLVEIDRELVKTYPREYAPARLSPGKEWFSSEARLCHERKRSGKDDEG